MPGRGWRPWPKSPKRAVQAAKVQGPDSSLLCGCMWAAIVKTGVGERLLVQRPCTFDPMSLLRFGYHAALCGKRWDHVVTEYQNCMSRLRRRGVSHRVVGVEGDDDVLSSRIYPPSPTQDADILTSQWCGEFVDARAAGGASEYVPQVDESVFRYPLLPHGRPYYVYGLPPVISRPNPVRLVVDDPEPVNPVLQTVLIAHGRGKLISWHTVWYCSQCHTANWDEFDVVCADDSDESRECFCIMRMCERVCCALTKHVPELWGAAKGVLPSWVSGSLCCALRSRVIPIGQTVRGLLPIPHVGDVVRITEGVRNVTNCQQACVDAYALINRRCLVSCYRAWGTMLDTASQVPVLWNSMSGVVQSHREVRNLLGWSLWSRTSWAQMDYWVDCPELLPPASVAEVADADAVELRNASRTARIGACPSSGPCRSVVQWDICLSGVSRVVHFSVTSHAQVEGVEEHALGVESGEGETSAEAEWESGTDGATHARLYVSVCGNAFDDVNCIKVDLLLFVVLEVLCGAIVSLRLCSLLYCLSVGLGQGAG